ncbi:MAG: PSD1 and planctomycete cytochrome C domain-containing protein [Planctomycetota bacterium]
MIFLSSALVLSLLLHDESPVRFNRDIRPILSQNCFPCHGPDASHREADLRLDVPSDARRVLTAEDAEPSELVYRVTTDDRFERMPPEGSHRELTDRDVQLLRRWVEQGAEYEGHWSLEPLRRTKVPGDGDHPIDAFIQRRLDQKGLSKAPRADARTLLRRLSFDLTGLPPRPLDVARFESNPSDRAFAAEVDRLLDSRHYGERMAAYWLDLVRYADSVGYHGDQERSVSPYRDFVIRAFNGNMPFDQFTTWQLAGDLLPNASLETRVASGYNRLLQTTEEGGGQPKEYRAIYAADRVRNVSNVWLGLTVGCAQCHDHKFDPIPTRDFYRLAAFFADIEEVAIGTAGPPVSVPTPEQSEQLAEIESELAALSKRLMAPDPTVDRLQREWEEKLREEIGEAPPKLSHWDSLGPFAAKDHRAAHDQDFGPEAGVSLAKRYGELQWIEHPEWRDGAIHELKGDDSATYLFRTITTDRARPLTLSLGSDDSLKVWLNGRLVLDRFVARAVAANQEVLTVELRAGRNELLMKVANGRGGYAFFFDVRHAIYGQSLAESLFTPESERTPDQAIRLRITFRDQTPALNGLRQRITEVDTLRKRLEAAIPTTLVSSAGEPRVTHVLPRGNWLDESGEVVQPGTPSALPPLEVSGRPSRLDLARWLVGPARALTARTFVNRLWMLFFGQGLARTLDDLGSQGEWPTHPELLDWLASELIDSGWNVKHIVRLMVTSETYRQSSLASDALRHRDPENRTFARQSRHRLPAEMVRDNALAVSGLLNLKVGGESVRPYQPAGYWSQLNFPKREYQADRGESLYRRTLYMHWQRTFLHPSLLAFDAPTREECTVKRSRSNTPLQALVLLNDPIYVEAARALAERIVKSGTQDEERIVSAIEISLARRPLRAEQDALTQLLSEHRRDYAEDPAAARSLLGVGEWQNDPDLDPVELAAWTSIARVLLNLHESITRY